MRFVRLTLLLGGLFNLTMGAIFFHNSLLSCFFSTTEAMERALWGKQAILIFPADPMHQLLIHGFGAGVMILGATLICSVRDPRRFLPFILLDGLGRLLYGATMIYYVLEYSLLKTIFAFGLIELAFAVSYLWASWYLNRPTAVAELSENT